MNQRWDSLRQLLACSPRARMNIVTVVELGQSTTRLIQLFLEKHALVCSTYAALPTPNLENITVQDLKLHLEKLRKLAGFTKLDAYLVVSEPASVMRNLELPLRRGDDPAQMVRLNASKLFHDKTFDSYYLDCLADKRGRGPSNRKNTEVHALRVCGVHRSLADTICTAARKAQYNVIAMIPNKVATAAGVESLPGRAFPSGTFALLEIGHCSSYVQIFHENRLHLHRDLPWGGASITEKIAEEMNLTRSVAESLKTLMPQKVLHCFRETLRENVHDVAATLECFEQQEEKIISNVIVTGRSAKSAILMELIGEELQRTCVAWNPTDALQCRIGDAGVQQLKEDGPGLAAAVGAALPILERHAPAVNLLKERFEQERMVAHDPLRHSLLASVGAVVVMLTWWGATAVQASTLKGKLADTTAARMALNGPLQYATNAVEEVTAVHSALDSAQKIACGRVLWGSVLNAIKNVSPDSIQLSQMEGRTSSSRSAEFKEVSFSKEKQQVIKWKQQLVLTLSGRNFGDLNTLQTFMKDLQNELQAVPQLTKMERLSLKSHVPVKDIDGLPEHSFFLIECKFEQRELYP